jgi:hypothetical protein
LARPGCKLRNGSRRSNLIFVPRDASDRTRPVSTYVAYRVEIEDRGKFGSPEQRFADRQICVSGVIQMYRGIPEIILRTPSQVEITQDHR